MNNHLTNARSQSLEQKLQWVELLDSIAENLDLSSTQLKNIEQAYKGVSIWLAESTNPLLADAEIYPQGSVRLKTAVRPLGHDEFDVDLILYLPHADLANREDIMSAVRQRLSEHTKYSNLMSELPRGFRINYAGDYHLDITPGKRHEHSWLQGQPMWIPDKKEGLKESNAKGMAEIFDEVSLLLPIRKTLKAANESYAIDGIEDFPAQHLKAPLNRIVQILKRHRDEWAQSSSHNSDHRPISVLITILAAWSYKNIIDSGKVYENDFDLILDVIESLPKYIQCNAGEFLVCNPAMEQENYAEKWNRTKNSEGEALRRAFNSWHQVAMQTFEQLALQADKGIDVAFDSLSESFGSTPVSHARKAMMEKLNEKRKHKKLGVALKTGAIITTSSTATPIRSNTFYGRRR